MDLSDSSGFFHLPELGVRFCRFSHGCSHNVGHRREIITLLFQMEMELNSLYLFFSAVWCQGCFNGSGKVGEGMSESLAF